MVRYVWGYLASFPPVGNGIGEKPQAAMPTLSASTQTCGHQNREGAERRRGGSNAAEVHSVWGEADLSGNTENRATGSPSGSSPMGRAPCLLSYNNNTTGNICSSAMITRHCDDTGDTSEKQTRSLPVGLPLRGKSEESTFLGTACSGLYMLICMLQTHSAMKVHSLCPGYR